jgi:hypothetical protein
LKAVVILMPIWGLARNLIFKSKPKLVSYISVFGIRRNNLGSSGRHRSVPIIMSFSSFAAPANGKGIAQFFLLLDYFLRLKSFFALCLYIYLKYPVGSHALDQHARPTQPDRFPVVSSQDFRLRSRGALSH